MRFETPPGQQLQSDWGQIDTVVGGRRMRVHFAVNLLGFSRRFHVWAASREDAEHYGFVPRACCPHRPQTKGKDERMVCYVKENFFQRSRAFESLAHLNQQLEQWLREVANERVHGMLKVRVADRFAREQPHLEGLPPVRFPTCYRETRRVALDAFIDVADNRYSVPAHLCGERVVIHRSLDGKLKVYNARGALVAEHRLRPACEGW